MNMKLYRDNYQKAFSNVKQPQPPKEEEIVYNSPSVIANNESPLASLYRIHSK